MFHYVINYKILTNPLLYFNVAQIITMRAICNTISIIFRHLFATQQNIIMSFAVKYFRASFFNDKHFICSQDIRSHLFPPHLLPRVSMIEFLFVAHAPLIVQIEEQI